MLSRRSRTAVRNAPTVEQDGEDWIATTPRGVRVRVSSLDDAVAIAEGFSVEAHASPDPSVVSHCCACGSGAVVARSDGSVECTMCHRQFTVAEQPAYSAVPGAPGAPGGPPPAPDESAPGSQHQLDLPPVDPQAAAAAPPFAVPEDADTTPNGSPAKDDNPFAKSSSTDDDLCVTCGYWKATDGDQCEACAEEDRPKYKTEKGASLTEDAYVRHLAMALHPSTRDAVLHLVRQ
jgi:hypothetical protein